MRLGILASHPIQYQAPWFRELAKVVELEVFFCQRQTATEQGKGAKRLVTELSKDKDLKKELAAKRVYDDLMKLPAADPSRQAGLRSLTKKFPDTHYAKVASGVDVDE